MFRVVRGRSLTIWILVAVQASGFVVEQNTDPVARIPGTLGR